MNFEKLENETEFEYGLRIIEQKVNREIDLDWDEICDLLKLDVHKDSLRKATSVTPYSGVAVAKYYKDKIANMIIEAQPEQSQNGLLMELEMKKRELYKERVKLRDERNERNKFYTSEARWENIVDLLKEFVVAYEPTPSDYISHTKYTGGKNEACLLLSDWHIGSEIWTFHNKFNLDIAKGRVDRLKQCVIDYCELHKVETLYIEMLGDLVSGNIHLTTRLNNNEDVIKQTIETSEILGDFIYELSTKVPNIKLVYCVGNHGRVSANVKESLNEENFEYLIRWYLETKLKNLTNVEWLYNTINKEICEFTLDNGRTIACSHGHKEKNYKDSTKILSHYLDVVKVDEVHMGHFHNPQLVNNVVINGTLAGCDDYSQDLRFNTIPCQVMRVYDTKGNFITYEINLN